MRILYLGNNRVGYEVLRRLESSGEDIVGLVVHPPDKRKYGEEIIAAADFDGTPLIYGDCLRDPETLRRIQSLGVCPRIRSWRRKPPRNNLLTVIWTLSWSN